MSSITTNIRIGKGGAFSIITQSLGLEAGGAIGIPLYIAQALAVTMYIFGFREGWNYIFPDHPELLVDIGSFALVFIVVNISTAFAFKIQYLFLVITIASVISIFGSVFTNELNTEIQWFGSYPGSVENGFSGSSFWLVFAVFFPAVTGIMAGANMSGDLKDPRRSIPKGTLWAVVLSTIIYVGTAFVLAYIATPEELTQNYNILIEKAAWTPIVLVGLLASTFSSALSSIVGAPRILSALGEHKILFMNDRLSTLDSRGEPRLAFFITSAIVLLGLLLRDLNAIAPLITMFFMITYAMINVVVLVEQGLGQVSFRPTFRVHILVPILGALGCFLVMFIINAFFGMVSIGIVLAVYAFLTRRKLDTIKGDTRSGIFNAVAEWSARVVNKLPEAPTIHSLKGERTAKRLQELADHFMDQGISARSALIQSPSFEKSAKTSMQSLKAAFFRPNILFISLSEEKIPYEKLGLGLEKSINMWVYFNNLESLKEHRVEHVNLAILCSYIFQRNWEAKWNIITVLNPEEGVPLTEEQHRAEAYMKKLQILARIPASCNFSFTSGEHFTVLDKKVPQADLNIFSMRGEEVDVARLLVFFYSEKYKIVSTSILFIPFSSPPLPARMVTVKLTSPEVLCGSYTASNPNELLPFAAMLNSEVQM